MHRRVIDAERQLMQAPPLLAEAAAQFVLGDLDVPTTPSAKLSPAVLAQEKLGWRLGIEAYTFHKFTFFETIEKTAMLGLPYIGGLSFMQHVSKDIPKNFDQHLSDDELRQIRLKMDSGGVRLLTYYAQDLFNTGAHELKAGLDIRPYNHVTRTRKYWMDSLGFYQYRLGLDYANYGLTQPYIYRGYNVKAAPGTPQDRYDNEVIVSAETAFLQDTWVISKNLALSLGLRFEHQRENMFYRDEIPAWMDAIYADIRNNIEFDDTGFAPRAGVTYNWDKVGVFKFHFGRYYEFVGTGSAGFIERNLKPVCVSTVD